MYFLQQSAKTVNIFFTLSSFTTGERAMNQWTFPESKPRELTFMSKHRLKYEKERGLETFAPTTPKYHVYNLPDNFSKHS